MSSELRWRQGDLSMTAFGREIGVSCDVRTLANGRRQLWQPVRSTTRAGGEGPYYDPRVFPVGLWYVTSVEQTDPPNDYLGRVFIRTNAHQVCEEWEVAQDDGLYYLRPTGQYIDDWGYLLHNSSSPTTLGCLRVGSVEEQMRMADECARRLADLRAISMEVVT
jgi:hypothetical protein